MPKNRLLADRAWTYPNNGNVFNVVLEALGLLAGVLLGHTLVLAVRCFCEKQYSALKGAQGIWNNVDSAWKNTKSFGAAGHWTGIYVSR